MRDRVRYRGLWYRRDVPIDRFEGSGVLAVTTEVDGVRLAAGTPVARDVDLGYVVARLAVPQQVYGVVLPAGTSLHLHRAHPRSRAHWVGTVLIAPLHLLILALLALFWRRRPAPRAPALRAMAYLRDDATVLGRTWPAGTVIRFSVGGRVDIGPAR